MFAPRYFPVVFDHHRQVAAYFDKAAAVAFCRAVNDECHAEVLTIGTARTQPAPRTASGTARRELFRTAFRAMRTAERLRKAGEAPEAIGAAMQAVPAATAPEVARAAINATYGVPGAWVFSVQAARGLRASGIGDDAGFRRAIHANLESARFRKASGWARDQWRRKAALASPGASSLYPRARYVVEPCPPWQFEIEPGKVVTGRFAYTVIDDGGEAVAAGPARTEAEAHRFAQEAMAVVGL
jgi:hypothetical protein